MTHLFEMSVTSRDDAIYTKSDLLIDPDGTPNHPQPEGPLIDLDELKIGDGWMRATSSAGRAAYEGVVAWSPSVGVGPRPAEADQARHRTSDVGHRTSEDEESGVRGPESEVPPTESAS